MANHVNPDQTALFLQGQSNLSLHCLLSPISLNIQKMEAAADNRLSPASQDLKIIGFIVAGCQQPVRLVTTSYYKSYYFQMMASDYQLSAAS